jgi:integrase
MAQIIKRGNVWYSDLRIQGKRVHRALSTDKRIAQIKLAEIIKDREASRHGHPVQNISWESFRDKFLEEQATKAQSTFVIYKGAIRHLEEFAPIYTLSQITPNLLTQLFVKWKQDNRGLYIRNREMRAIKTMMRQAEALGYIEKRDWSYPKFDKEPTGRLLWYTPEELQKLKKVCKGVWKTLLYLCSRAGLRRSEAYWLEWTDVDFERGKIHVAPKDGWSPKDHERRYVDMTDDLRAYLQGLPRHSQWVLQDNGSRPNPHTLSVYFRTLVHKAGLKGHIHALRHSFGSQLASAGVSIYVIRDLMGHSNVATTQIYAHLSPASKEAAVHKLPSI